MEIELKPLKLEKKKGTTAYSGKAQTIMYVLVIAMLEDDEYYRASSAAATAFQPTLKPSNEKEYYNNLLNLLRNWANSPSKEISKYPDNGPKGKRTTKCKFAMWRGSTWKSHVAAAIWNLVVGIFDEVCAMHEADQAKGLAGVTYWWDCKEEKIVRKRPEKTAIVKPAPHTHAVFLRPVRMVMPHRWRWKTLISIAAITITLLFLRPGEDLNRFQKLERPKDTEWMRRAEYNTKGDIQYWPMLEAKKFYPPSLEVNQGVPSEVLAKSARHPIIDQVRMVFLLDH